MAHTYDLLLFKDIFARKRDELPKEMNSIFYIETLPKKTAKDRYISFLRNCPAKLYTLGYPIDWERIQGCGTRQLIRLPSYPWQERTYWYRDSEPEKCIKRFTGKKELSANMSTSQMKNTIDSSSKLDKTHPLLGNIFPTEACSGLLAWTSEIDLHKFPFLEDHKFNGSKEAVIPGAFYLEMALAMSMHLFPDVPPVLRNVTFENLLTLKNNEIARFCTRLNTRGKPEACHHYQMTKVEKNGNEILVSKGFVSFDVTKHSFDKGKVDVKSFFHDRHTHGHLLVIFFYFCNLPSHIFLPKITVVKIPLEDIKSQLVKQSLDAFNLRREQRGFAYGPQFSLIAETWCSQMEALCSVSLTDEIRCSLPFYVVHPSIIDSCIQSLFLLANSVEKPVPYGVAEVKIHRVNFTDVMYCHVKHHVKHDKNHVNYYKNAQEDQTYDIVLMDCHGNAVLSITEFKMVDLSKVGPTRSLTDVTYHVLWEEVKIDDNVDVVDKIWLISPDQYSYADQFMKLIPDDNPKFIFQFPETFETSIRNAFLEVLKAAYDAFKSSKNYKNICVVNFLPVNTHGLSPQWIHFRQAHQDAFESSLILLQTIASVDYSDVIQLILVTCDAIPISLSQRDTLTFPWSSSLLGFRRTQAEEMTSPKICIADLSIDSSNTDLRLMLNDLQLVDIEEEIVYRDGLRYLNRIKRFDQLNLKKVKHSRGIEHIEKELDLEETFDSGKFWS